MRHDPEHAEPGLVHPEVAAALGRLAELAATRQPDEGVLPEFLARYYRELPEPDLDDRRLDALYSVAVAHFRIGRQRRPGETLVRVISPDTGLDESRPPRSILFVVTDDAPFLVDTTRMVVERHRLDIHLMVHPKLYVARDESGVATRVAPDAGPTEAWTQVEIDYCDAVAAARLEADALAAVADVHLVVDDFPAMRERMAALAEHDPILKWLAVENFVFLGAAEYDRTVHGLIVRDGTQLGQLRAEHEIDPPPVEADSPLGSVVISRSEAASTIHRGSRRTCVSVRDGDLERRFVGLLGSGVYRQSVLSIPTVGDRARAVLGLVDAATETHKGRSVRNTLETLPRDLLFELDADRLAHLVIDIVGLQERQLVRIFDVAEPVGAWSTVLVYLPRTRFTARLPEIVAEAVAAAYHSSYRDVESLVGASTLARITLTVRRPDGLPPVLDRLADVVDELTTSWDDRLRSVLTRELGVAAGRSLYERVGVHAPADFRANVPPARAVSDLERIDRLLASGHGLTSEMNHDEGAPADEWRFRVYRRGEPAALSELLPLLAHLGLVALDERPSTFVIGGDRVHLYDIGVRVPPGTDVGTAQSELESTFEGLMSGDVEADGFNRLVSVAGLTARQVSVLRAYAKYLRQIGFAFSQSYIEDTFSRLPHLATRLTELFEAKFDPALADREAALVAARGRLTIDLDAIQLLDDDRICRAFLMLIDATVRTNRYLGKPTLSFKLDPAAIPDLPRPRPMFEIFVCSPRVEGVHLRAGPIARGGIRWSDRREDFRTEVLGLVKAQMVKNAVIVPVGAKGGFVVKTPMSDPAQQRIEGEECYCEFVRGMLDLTDNVVGGVIEHPPDMVIYDGDDPYLVVAADKGTATFSDTANAVAAEYGFWLGDAFASGGSAGYDHKVMGITARGAWESIRRHARVLGKDADSDPITAVGIGDMSGDVFGNGMLRSRRLRLIAAFDHRHIFIDPDPDAEMAFTERKRLFGLPRSSWDDYDTRLISAGGGVYPRSAKSIALSVDARTALGTTAERVTPIELIRTILTAPVDMLWNGGIGTYVKASSETHAEVGDRANDALRVDASELRCRMVGEGGNLGFTQLGRVEYALADGLIYNDAIDNSGGVDCSDHEVNIKILLSDVVAAGELPFEDRDRLLVEMTDEVAQLVLDNNRAQTLALMIARRQALPMANVHARYLTQLEAEHWLDREHEFLPTDRQVAERQSAGRGLLTPELAVVMAYTKNADVADILLTDLPDDPALASDLSSYFPGPLRDRYADAIRTHWLRREITTTRLVNQMVNLSGISYDHRMTEDTGASTSDVARAWIAMREIFGFAEQWRQIDELRTTITLDTQLDLFLDCRRTAERCSLWMLRHRHPPIDIAAAIVDFRPGIQSLLVGFDGLLSGRIADSVYSTEAARLAAGVPESLAQRSAVWKLLHTGFDLIEIASREGVPLATAATVYWQVFDRLDLMWLWDAIGALPRSDRWQTQARSALRDDLMTVLAELAGTVMRRSGGSTDSWIGANERPIARALEMFAEIRRAEVFNLTNLSVALRQLRNLGLTSVHER